MIKNESFSAEHIKYLRETSKRDPILLERTVFAFGLLEAIARSGLPFVFKGGTCLMLLLEKPRRLSTDIDIIVAPGTDIDSYLKAAAEIFPFITLEEQERKGRNNIVKRHFKFSYDSPVKGNDFYIILDVLFEDNHYTNIIEKQIKNSLLITEEPYLQIKVPSIECILGDKMTAFAPHTTGIPLGIGKELEVMKQFYDIWTLLDEASDFNAVKETYYKIVKSEMNYRGLTCSEADCLKDTLDCCVTLATRGKNKPEEFSAFVNGIRSLSGHVYGENYSPEVAANKACKVIYFVTCLIYNRDFEPSVNAMEFQSVKLKSEKLLVLKGFRKTNPEAYAWICQADAIISE